MCPVMILWKSLRLPRCVLAQDMWGTDHRHSCSGGQGTRGVNIDTSVARQEIVALRCTSILLLPIWETNVIA